MKITIAITAVLAILFSGCGSKKYYEPNDDIYYLENKIESMNSKIIDYNPNGATLEDLKYVSKNGVSSIYLNDGYSFLNDQHGAVLAADNNGSLFIKQNDKIDYIQFDKRIISGTKKDNLIALSFIDNSIALYDIDEKKTKFKDYYNVSIVNDIKIASPIFLETVILYPTLDGKVVIVDLESNNVLKTINFDPKSEVNNIIFLDTIDQTLVAATTKKLFVFKDGKVNIADLDIKYIALGDGYIYVSTLDGEILKMNDKLHILESKKFTFAKFYSLSFGSYLYALESQGYLIRLNDDFSEVTIFDIPLDEDEKVISIENKIYFEDSYITLD